jgi:hypothetical protein
MQLWVILSSIYEKLKFNDFLKFEISEIRSLENFQITFNGETIYKTFQMFFEIVQQQT